MLSNNVVMARQEVLNVRIDVNTDTKFRMWYMVFTAHHEVLDGHCWVWMVEVGF